VPTKSCLSKGASRLATKGSQSELAARLGVTQQAVSRWLSAQGLPSGKHLLQIAKAYRIPISDWYEPAAVSADESGAHPAVPADKTG
jgi:transcriptional regulator with XRE-family HTH domain